MLTAAQEVENADDLRLSQRLFKKCMGDKKKFCADMKFGAPFRLIASNTPAANSADFTHLIWADICARVATSSIVNLQVHGSPVKVTIFLPCTTSSIDCGSFEP